MSEKRLKLIRRNAREILRNNALTINSMVGTPEFENTPRRSKERNERIGALVSQYSSKGILVAVITNTIEAHVRGHNREVVLAVAKAGMPEGAWQYKYFYSTAARAIREIVDWNPDKELRPSGYLRREVVGEINTTTYTTPEMSTR